VLGRALLDSDHRPGAPSVVVLGHDAWQHLLGGRSDVIGSVVKVGNTPSAVVGVMPKGFGYPVNHDAWAPLSLGGSYRALEGGAISVIGRLAPGASLERANAELRVFGERTAASLPATHQHLRPRARRLGESQEGLDIAQLAQRNLPVLLVLMIACMSVGTLVYARTATREGEITVRSALGASRGRIIGQLFVEALVLATVAAAAGVIAADRAVTWVMENFNKASGGAPFLDNARPEALDDSVCLRCGGRQRRYVVIPARTESHASAHANPPREPRGGRRDAALRQGLDRRNDRPGCPDSYGHPSRPGDCYGGDAQLEDPRTISKPGVCSRSYRPGSGRAESNRRSSKRSGSGRLRSSSGALRSIPA
jgi:MacB-like periplasmic core domain